MLLRLIFILCIFQPTFVVYAHEYSKHEHEYCQESTVHFHEYEEDCCLDNFILNIIYSSSTNNYKSLVFLFNSEIFEIEVFKHEKNPLNFLTRGPPSN